MTDLLAAALSLAAAGVPVFPCKWRGPSRKSPLTLRGFHDATCHAPTLRAWWRAWPQALLGMPTGTASGTAVIDVDPQGLPWLYAKSLKRSLPPTRTHRSPRGGYHLVYQCPEVPIRNSASKLAAGVDTRGEGGYVILPPSPGYEVWDESPPAPFPRWVIAALGRKKTAPGTAVSGAMLPLDRFVLASPEGQRNTRLFWAACRAGERGEADDARQRLIAAAIAAGLPLIEAEKTVASGLARGGRGGT